MNSIRNHHSSPDNNIEVYKHRLIALKNNSPQDRDLFIESQARAVKGCTSCSLENWSEYLYRNGELGTVRHDRLSYKSAPYRSVAL